MPTLQDAIDHLYKVAVVESSTTSTLRLQTLAEYCAGLLEKRGLKDVQTEVELPGGARPKRWDIAWSHNGKYRLAISLKSLLKNLGGTVPNRIDDLIGEVANLQMFSPEIVTGYLILFNTAEDTETTKHGGSWCEVLEQRLEHFSGRRRPAWGTGMVEASCVVRLDFSAGPKLLTEEAAVETFMDTLVEEVLARNPGAGDGNT